MYSNIKQRVEVQVVSRCVEESQEEGWCLVGEEFRQETNHFLGEIVTNLKLKIEFRRGFLKCYP